MTGEVSPLGRDDEPAPPDQSHASPPDQLPAPDQLRASHEDRDRVVELLRVAAGDGRLTADELDEANRLFQHPRSHDHRRVRARPIS
jgi:hypothetical protein